MASEVSEVSHEVECSPTETLREMLDERGIKYTTDDSNDYEIVEWKGSYNLWWQFVYDPYEEEPYGELRLLNTGGSTHLTPEQAIAATVGVAREEVATREQESIVCDFLRKISPERDWMYLGEVEHALIDEMVRAIAATVGKDIEHYDGSGRRATVAILQGGRKPEEVLFVREGGVTHYLPEDVGTCEWCKDGKTFDKQTVMMTNHGWQRIRHCPNCGRRVIKEEAE